MPVWSYSPQQAFPETISAPGMVNDVSPATRIVGALSTRILREWRLRYSVLDTPTCSSMAAFYTTQNGPLYAFDFWNVNDSQTYRVRFSDAMRIEMWTPVYMRTNEIVLTEVTS